MTRSFLILIFSSLLFSCRSLTGSGNIISQVRHPGQVEGIKLSGSIDVEVIQGSESKVEVEADDNVMPFVVTIAEDGLLNVYLQHNRSYHNIHAKVYVTTPAVDRLMVTGSGTISSSGVLKDNEQIDCRIAGSGDINAEVDAPAIMANITGSGAVKLRGRTRDLNCTITGSGDIRCRDLLSENTEVRITGSGAAHVYASVNLSSKITGSGDVYFSGKPAHITGRAKEDR